MSSFFLVLAIPFIQVNCLTFKHGCGGCVNCCVRYQSDYFLAPFTAHSAMHHKADQTSNTRQATPPTARLPQHLHASITCCFHAPPLLKVKIQVTWDLAAVFISVYLCLLPLSRYSRSNIKVIKVLSLFGVTLCLHLPIKPYVNDV